MTLKQFNDKALAHYSYAVVSNGKMALIDPSRNPQQYYAYAEEQDAKIVAVIETHPHADFVS
ncbi:MAG: MBL fold metallo-hydrolase, partial [Mesonia sp.]